MILGNNNVYINCKAVEQRASDSLTWYLKYTVNNIFI